MSRIGKQPIPVPGGVEVKVEGSLIKVKGPKGKLEKQLHRSISVAVEGGIVKVNPVADTKENRKFHGLSRTLVSNMIAGCFKGYERRLTLVGVGYRAAKQGKGLNLSLGFSHPVYFEAAEGVDLNVEKNTTIIVTGASKEDVGETAAKIRGLRPPEPYHGKGVRYEDEKIATKVGKSGSKK